LIEVGGADVESTDWLGISALMEASSRGR
jgi:hypothetical protein